MRTSLVAVVLVAAGACKVVTPPPLVVRHRGTEPPPPGTTTVMVMIGFGGQLLADDGVGVQVVGSHQVSGAVEAGVGLGFAKNTGKRDPDSSAPRLEWLLATRAYVTLHPPDVEWTCATVGAGAGMGSTGLRYWTADVVASVGVPGDVQPHLDLSLAYASPWTTGGTFSATDKLPAPTWHLGASLGAAGHIDRHLVSGEVTLIQSRGGGERAPSILISGAYAYTP